MSKMIQNYDSQQKGGLDRAELQALLADLTSTDVTLDELDFFFSVNDSSGDGMIGPDELPAVLRIWDSHIHELEYVRDLMTKFDGNRDGGLQREELRKLLQDLNDGMDVDDAEVDYVMEEADLMGNGVVTSMELKRAIAFWYGNVHHQRVSSRTCSLL
ncbi:unnamed protein product [Symbiodinium natans]|uniref:EF-hand domain-containing protein n=1 Tax=Symbiodinium natans TaxID=878477 RepID=A0A812J7W4_9DINO|nr:unnamed protein product [Symbiodinium natans]